MKTEQLEEFNRLFARAERKDKAFHFGFKTWDDVRSDTLTHVSQKYNMYDPARSFGAWAQTIISNQVKNQKRNACSRNKLHAVNFSQDATLHSWMAYLNNDPVEDYEQKQKLENLRHVIKEAWQTLTFFQKKLLVSRFKYKRTTYRHFSRRRTYDATQRAVNIIVQIAKVNDLHIRGLKTFER